MAKALDARKAEEINGEIIPELFPDVLAQRIELVLKYKPVIQEQARRNESAGGGDKVRQEAKAGLVNLPNPVVEPVHTRDTLANLAGVSSRTFANAAVDGFNTDRCRAVIWWHGAAYGNV